MQRIFYRLALMMGLIGMLWGCDGSVPLKDLPSQLILEAYKPTGELVARRVVASDDPIYQRLKLLLDAEQTGWKKSVVSYKTGPYILRSENLIIRCYADSMVIDVVDSGRSTSMRKGVPNLLQVLGLPAN